ncbi:MAG TPA: hypothetical protein VFD33_00530 [Bacillota bacterium]|nr:hypothetical protein [Bacillota bacterium]
MDTSYSNNSLIYWKWDNSSLEEQSIIEKVSDLCSRTKMQYVSLGLHWVEKEFFDEELLAALKVCSRELHKHGRKFIVEVCSRKEGEAFFRSFPNDIAYLTTATEVQLDDHGKGRAEVDTSKAPHFWRISQHQAKILCGYTLVKGEGNRFESGSQALIKEGIVLETDPSGKSSVEVDLGGKLADKQAVVFVGVPQPIPDLASENINKLYTQMLDALKGINVDGLMSDEWGYDVNFGIDENPEDPKMKGEVFFKHISYSKNFDKSYQDLSGESLLENLLYLFYEDDGNRGRSIKAVNDYHKTFRSIMRRNDEDMYRLAKEKLGDETFYGAHPTWWGNNYKQNFEGFKNGFYWWEAKRDIAQTDEIVIMPIRTALAHKWESPYWYNMWYSMGTRDIKTYYRESWENLRFGGRTHYLSYECPNEQVVLELKPEPLLENIEEMDRLIRTTDPYQKAAADSRVLILFGMENSLNWFYNDQVSPPWYPEHKVLSKVLECTDRVFADYLCDLVPTSEIINGSLKIDEGKVTYGSQEYDAVVLLGPDSMEPGVFTFISKLDPSRLMVAGDFSDYYDGSPLSDEDISILKRGIYEEDLYCPEKIVSVLKEWDIDANRFDNGCVMQDGSIIFTAEGKQASGNPLRVEASYKDTHISFEGEDFLLLRKGDKGFQPHYLKGNLSIK